MKVMGRVNWRTAKVGLIFRILAVSRGGGRYSWVNEEEEHDDIPRRIAYVSSGDWI